MAVRRGKSENEACRHIRSANISLRRIARIRSFGCTTNLAGTSLSASSMPCPDRAIRTKMPNPSLRPTYREVTACGGTFPDTVTYLHGFRTPIGFLSFGLGPRAPATGASAVRTTGLLTFRSGNPSRNARSDAAVPALRTVGVQSLLHTGPFYQLAFFTPGIRPFEAISRNWIRLMPNRRI